MACGGYTGSGLVLAMAAGQSNANLRQEAEGKEAEGGGWETTPRVLF